MVRARRPLGYFYSLIRINSTSYHNRKSGSGTSSSVVPPDFPCSSRCLLRVPIPLCHCVLFNDSGRATVQSHHSGICSGRCRARHQAEGRSEEAHTHRPFVVDVYILSPIDHQCVPSGRKSSISLSSSPSSSVSQQ